LQKAINKIKTNLLEPGEPKDADTSAVFQIWCAFADEAERQEMRAAFEAGLAWGEAKKRLFERVNDEIAPARDEYDRLMANPGEVETILREGAERVRPESVTLLDKVRRAVGLRPFTVVG
jgi:tryptophanyl-tRNA synthetase